MTVIGKGKLLEIMVMKKVKGSVGRCDSYQRDVKGIRKVCQLMERCDGHGGAVRRCGKV